MAKKAKQTKISQNDASKGKVITEAKTLINRAKNSVNFRHAQNTNQTNKLASLEATLV